jgi:glucose/arabinose dehydrogenase
MKYISLFFLLLALPFSLCAYPSFVEDSIESDGFTITKIVESIPSGWGMAVLPDDQLIVSEWKGSTVWYLNFRDKRIFPVLENNEVYQRGQGGQLGLWVDREFEKNAYVYLSKSISLGGETSTELTRYVFENKKLVRPKSLVIASPFVNASHHFGGAITQDENGLIYLSVGDRGEKHQAQSLENHLGKILVMDRDGHPQGLNKGYLYSYGQRNPQGLYYSIRQKMLYEAEHGPRGGDEVNHIELGKNYGWPIITYGKNYIGTKVGEGITEKQGMEQPLHYYVPSIAVSDVHLYESSLLPRLEGKILVGSLKASIISVLGKKNNHKWEEERRLFESLGERWRSIERDSKGQVYLLAQSGSLYVIKK